MNKEIISIEPDHSNLRFGRQSKIRQELHLNEHYIGFVQSIGASLALTLRVGSADFPCCSGTWQLPHRFADKNDLIDFLQQQNFVVADNKIGTVNWVPADWSMIPAEYQADVNERCLAAEERLGRRLVVERGEEERCG